jgi:hypothetical protein
MISENQHVHERTLLTLDEFRKSTFWTHAVKRVISGRHPRNKMSSLSPDFESKSQAKLRQLRIPKNAGVSQVSRTMTSDPSKEAFTSAVAAEPVVVHYTPEEISSDVVVNEKLVKLSDVAVRKVALKDCPVSLDLVASEEDIAKYSLEALKKLAKASALELPKQVNKPTAVSLLVNAYRSKGYGGEGRETHAEEAAACLR